MTMRDQVHLSALVGLLHGLETFQRQASGSDDGRIRQHVPRQWRDHGRSEGHIARIVTLADRLAAGAQDDKRDGASKQLLSIFCCLQADDRRAQEQRYWPLEALKLDEEALFPEQEWTPGLVSQGYENLWRSFREEIERLGKTHQGDGALSVYVENLLLMMQRYTWCVPCAHRRALPDVSLYDHSRMTGALAACLAESPQATVDALLQDPRVEEPVALLVGGDISGVQEFIYTITARGATSALRGRSFYLQLLTEAVARFLLRELELPITNLIYQGGGGFYLLARHGDSDRLRTIQQKVSHILLAHHRGDLYLALAAKSLNAVDFYDGRISDQWTALTRTLRETKQRRFSELGQDMKALFVPQGRGGTEAEQCQACGREHPETEEEIEGENRVRKCPPCISYESLGDDLRHTRYLWLEEIKPRGLPADPLGVTPGGWEAVLAALGVRGGVDKEVPQGDGDRPRLILALKDDALGALRPDPWTAVGRRLLVNVTPIITQSEIDALRKEIADLPRVGSVKPFSVLEFQSAGIKRLGMLRMDVDDLGRLFSKGFMTQAEDGREKSIATFSRVATLSFAVSLYFEGWVERIAEDLNKQAQKEGRGEALYSIYSGGDDLFFVGLWDVVVELARRIRVDLPRFAADHPGIHASAGIALVGGKYPLYQAAQDAGAAEGLAKNLKWQDGERKRTKDAVTFLGQAMPWEHFGLEPCEKEGMATSHALAHRLVRMVRPSEQGGDGVPQALVQRLIRLQQMYEEAAEEKRRRGEDLTKTGEEQVYWGPWMWRGYYYLKRMARQYKGGPAGPVIKTLAEKLHGDRFRGIEWIGLAARWADLLTR